MRENVEAIVDYFKSGIKKEGEQGRLGVELEHIVVGPGNSAVAYGDEHGVGWLLEQLESEYAELSSGDAGALIGLAGGNKAVTLEPAAQLELSAGPFENGEDARVEFTAFQREVIDLIDPYGYRLVEVGYHPTAKADDLPFIPKERYRFMDDHFAKIGPYGRRMMRGSASTQISIDYYSVEDCLRKLRLATAAAPLFALICDNSPAFEGEPSPHHMMRTEIWRECDPARCNAVPGALDRDFTLEKYAEYILNTPAIFYYDEEGVAQPTEQTFGEIYADRAMTRADVEHALSMFFNDVRCKTYIEIRPADALPLVYVAAYATLVKGLFYFPESLDFLDELFAGVDEAAVEAAKTELMAKGYDAQVYGKAAGEIVDELFKQAHSALPQGEAMLLNPLEQLTRMRKTLAMMGKRKK